MKLEFFLSIVILPSTTMRILEETLVELFTIVFPITKERNFRTGQENKLFSQLDWSYFLHVIGRPFAKKLENVLFSKKVAIG